MRPLKIIITVILIFLCIIGVGLYYLDTVFIPGPFKKFIMAKAHDFLDRDVFIEEMNFHITQGIVLKGIRIAEKDHGPAPLLNIEEISLGMPFPDFFRTGNVLIPFVTIRKPYVHLIRTAENDWNITELLNKKKTAPSSTKTNTPGPKKSNIIVGLINIEHGRIDITDQTTENIVELNASAHLSLQGDIDFHGGFRIPAHSSSINAQGHFSPASKVLNATLDAQNFDAGYFIKLLNKPLFIEFKQGLINNTSLVLRLKGRDFSLEGSASVPLDMVINIQNKIQIRGDTQVDRFSISRSADVVQIKGGLTSPHAFIVLGQQTDEKILQGNLAAKNLMISINLGKSAEVTGDIQLNEGQFTLPGQNKKISGNFSGDKVIFRRVGDELNLAGNFSVQKAQLVFANQSLNGDLSWINGSLQIQGSSLKILGGAKITNALFQGPSFSAEGILTVPTFVLNKTADGINLLAEIFSAENLEIKTPDGKKISSTFDGHDLEYNFANSVTQAKGQLATSVLLLNGFKNFKFSGRPEINFDLTYNPALETNPYSYRGTVLFKHDTVSGFVSGFWKGLVIRAMDGKINFTPDTISTDHLELTVGKTVIDVNGRVEDFKDPRLTFTANSKTINLDDWAALSPKLAELQIQITGVAKDVTLEYAGLLSSPTTADVKAVAIIQETEITAAKLPAKISGVNGDLKYEARKLSWDNLGFSYQEQAYTTSGSLKNFTQPEIEATLSSQDFKLTGQGALQEKIISITSLKGQYHKTLLDIKGDLTLQDGPPDVDLNGRIDLDLADLSFISQISGISGGLEEKLKTLQPVGILEINGRAVLPALMWKKLTLNAKATSPQISLAGYHFKDVTLTAAPLQNNRQGLNLNATIYNGKLSVDTKVSLQENNFPAEISAELLDLDLAKLKTEIAAMKDKDYAGLLSANTTLTGPLTDLKNIQGKGALQIKDGRIVELNLLKGIWKYLLVEEFQNIVFTEARATFKIAGAKLTTDDLTMKSAPVDLEAQGWVDFNGNIDFNVHAEVRQASLISSEAIKTTPTAILAQAQKYFGVKITGTFAKPQYQVKPLPFKVIEKTTGSILQGIGGILEDVFQP